jgi:hypothetical protein
MKMSSGQGHKAAGQLHAFVEQVHAPVGRVGRFSHGGTTRVVLALVLVAVAVGVAGAGLRLRVAVRLPRPGQTARTLMLTTWGLAIVAFLVCFSTYVHQLIQQHLIHSRPPQPIFPITAACMIALFFAILHMGRSLNQEARLGSAFIGAIAAPTIFEFPFDLIVMTRTYPAVAPDPALYRCWPSRRCSSSNHAGAPVAVSVGTAVPGGLLRLRADAADLRGLGALRIGLPLLAAPLHVQRSVESRGLRCRAQPVPPPARPGQHPGAD